MKAPVSYFGGKNVMFHHIIENFPEKESYDTYIEPFGGTYSVGLNMPYIPPNEIYNDLEKNIYSLYKVLQDEELYKEFAARANLLPYDANIREEFKDKLDSGEELTILDRAFMFFYVSRTSFNGTGGFQINTYVRRGMPKSVSSYLGAVENLENLHLRIKKLIVSNSDALSLMKRFDKENVFMYLDPPYVHSTRTSMQRYDFDMTDEQHDSLIDFCINSKAKLLISGYDNEMYNRLIDNGFTKVSFNTNNREETLWRNY